MPDDAREDLEDRFARGDEEAVGPLLERFRARLRKMIELRLDARVRGRVDASDVVQDAFLEATARYAEYRREAKLPPYVWVRFLVSQNLARAYRNHLGAEARDVRREKDAVMPGVESERFARDFTDDGTRPDQHAVRAELQGRVQAALESLDPVDREIVTMRHFERMTNAEVGAALSLSAEAVSKRFIRALRRVKEAL